MACFNIPRSLVLALASGALVALSGCESMSASQCQVADWYRVGQTDGANGVAESRLADYAEDCAKVGIRPDAQAYRRGWDVGLAQFCQPANGWRQGVQGQASKESLCAGRPDFPQFSRNLQNGLAVYRTNEQIRRNNDEIARLQKRLEKAANDGERNTIRRELSAIDREQFRLRLQLGQQQLLAP